MTFAWNLNSMERFIGQFVRGSTLHKLYSVLLTLSLEACLAHIPRKSLFSDLCSNDCPLCLIAPGILLLELGRSVKDIQSCLLLRIRVPSGICFTHVLHPGNARADLLERGLGPFRIFLVVSVRVPSQTCINKKGFVAVRNCERPGCYCK